jgi:hypothetical protein
MNVDKGSTLPELDPQGRSPYAWCAPPAESVCSFREPAEYHLVLTGTGASRAFPCVFVVSIDCDRVIVYRVGARLGAWATAFEETLRVHYWA